MNLKLIVRQILIITKKGVKYENQHERVWERNFPLAQKRRIRGHFVTKRQRIRNILDWSYPDGYRDKLATITCPPFGGNNFCLIAGIKTSSKNFKFN